MQLGQIKGIDIKRIRIGPPKISAKQLATYLGVTPRTIFNWENDVGSPSVLQFITICFYCKISAGKYLSAIEARKNNDYAIKLDDVRKNTKKG